MSIEYVLDHKCPVKEALTQQRLVALVKTRFQAQSLIEFLREKGDNRPLNELKVTRRRHTLSGNLDAEEVSVQQMLDETTELDPHAGHCSGCPANANARPFGCYGSITYPIREATERWLLSLIPDDLSSAAGQLLQQMCADFDYDGGPFVKMRSDTMFFDRPEPLACSWGTEDNRWTLDANQVLQMLFGVGNLAPSHCLIVLWFLGVIPHDIDLAEIGGFDGLKQALSEHEVPFDSEDGQIYAMIRFFRAMRAAALLDVELLIDM
jgi:hypothetical protein